MPLSSLTLSGNLIGEAEAAGAEDRLRALIEVHYDFVWRSLRRLGMAPGDVDDGAQQVFLVASRKLDAIREGSERSFLYQTALRVAADARRARKRRREVIGEEVEHVLDCAPGADDLTDLHRARKKLDHILDAMTLELRAVFTLFELDQLTLTEIATLLEVPRGTVASRLRRARVEFFDRAARLAGRGKDGAKR
jgi:RNA polymerase sigma-70 factor, ECF subfamily